jgi:methyl-accepting chemotaxis protein
MRLPRVRLPTLALSIKARLSWVVISITVIALVLGASGWWLLGQANQRMMDVYANRIEPMVALQRLSDHYQVGVTGAVGKVRTGNLDWPDARQHVTVALNDIRGSWEQYRQLPKALEEERKLATDVDRVLNDANRSVEQLLSIMESENYGDLDNYARTRMPDEVMPAVEALTALLDFEREHAAEQYANNVRTYGAANKLILALMAVWAVVAMLGMVTTVRGVSLPLERITGAMRAVADGQAALAAIKCRPPDLVTLDVEMPQLDGLATLTHICQR